MLSSKALIGGSMEANLESAGNSQHGDMYVWFRAAAAGQMMGLAKSIWERMLWEEYRAGWIEEAEEGAGKAAGGFVPVERFVVKRLDVVAVTFDFAHLNNIKTKLG
ncbi:hypothetical protein PR202_ga20914 [Eleusine coracana subsp. coracana]|uniref:Uncharacterized protein n=1 Tax=Eleusine coracana subsp. coracana TaxID=191504 RepID=A0AAV5CXU6_ELECO|nr:hypothetical protein PR202_ga20914 [Eleusine coracana subsp. coracana]